MLYKYLLYFLLFSSISGFSCMDNRDTGDNWTHFRGSLMNGHAEVKGAPVHWSEDLNIVWKNAVKGSGWSSPVIYNDQVWLTSASEDGREFYTLCYDLNTGHLLDDKIIFRHKEPQRINRLNSYATPTPCIEENFVYVHYGTFGTACIDTRNFEIVWKREDLKCDHMQGPASSPIINDNTVFIHLEGVENPYVVALDKRTGKTIWKSVRPAEIYDPLEPVYRKSYQTPIVIKAAGRELLISNSSYMCFAHDVKTGEVIWTFEYGYDSTVSQPLFWNGLVFVNSGWIKIDNRPYFTRQYAVDPEGRGDITGTHVKWVYEDDVPQLSTPVIVDGNMYMIHDRGMLTCLDALEGRPLWKEKLKGNYNSSPVFAAGYIYFFSVKGDCTIIKPGGTFQKVAENSIGEMVKTVPAFVNGDMVLRTDQNLYLIR